MLSAGIVGLPNVGKSTLFNAVTRTHKAPAENYPFCTIDPNVGVVIVPDPRLEKTAEISHSKKITPTAIEFVDIAGLVKGASAGEGLGNQFSIIFAKSRRSCRWCVVFENPDVHHVSATIDPVRDIEVINTELVWLTSLRYRSDATEYRSNCTPAKKQQSLKVRSSKTTSASRPREAGDYRRVDSRRESSRARFLPADVKTNNFCLQCGGVGFGSNFQRRLLERSHAICRFVQDYARHHFATEAIVISAHIESELVDLTEQEALEYLRGLGVEDSGVHALIRAVYHLLGLRTFLTTGEKETRAWTIHAGDKAPAGRRSDSLRFLSAGLSQRKPFIITIWSRLVLSRKHAKPANCAWRGKITKCAMAT